MQAWCSRMASRIWVSIGTSDGLSDAEPTPGHQLWQYWLFVTNFIIVLVHSSIPFHKYSRQPMNNHTLHHSGSQCVISYPYQWPMILIFFLSHGSRMAFQCFQRESAALSGRHFNLISNTVELLWISVHHEHLKKKWKLLSAYTLLNFEPVGNRTFSVFPFTLLIYLTDQNNS